MVDLTQALVLCARRIVKKETHPYYERVNKLATLYEQLITGEDHDSLLQQVFGSVEPYELKKLKELTFPITSSVSNALMFAYSKVLRTEPSYQKIDFESDKDGKSAEKLNKAIDKYYADSSVDYFIEKRFHDLSFTDPNGFIVTDFKPFDAKVENAKPFPVEITSAEAVNYSYTNKVLDFLLVELPNGGQLIKLICYLPNDGVIFTEVAMSEADLTIAKDLQLSKEPADQDKWNNGYFLYDVNDIAIAFIYQKRKFLITYFAHKSGKVPAISIGYIPDKKTNGVTYVNPFHYGALPYLMKSIKSVAELDITANKHAFPQKIVYKEKCQLSADGICPNSNQRADQCTKCERKGFLHESGKDVIAIAMPRDPKDIINLDQLVVYKAPPVDLVKWQQDYVDELVQKCYKAVFNSETFSVDQVVQTATAKTIDLQNVYDTLSGYASKIEEFWETTIEQIAVLLDINDAIVELKYPRDFKLKNISDLLLDLKTATDSEAPVFVKAAIQDDIANIIYADRPADLKKYNSLKALFPFPGKSKDEILMALNAGLCTKADSVCWTYFELLTNQLEVESLKDAQIVWKDLLDEKGMAMLQLANKSALLWYYDLPYPLQLQLLDAKVQAKVVEIDGQTSNAQPFGGAPSRGGLPPKFKVGDNVTIRPGNEHTPDLAGKTLSIVDVHGTDYTLALPGGGTDNYVADDLILANA